VALRSTAPILLTGPTGAGKSFLANRIYQLKQSRHQVSGKLVAVNCATLRGDNAMSTLFGHVKGAFTGALSARSGLLREADGGVLFSTRLPNWAWMNRRCCSKPLKRKLFPVWLR
jgi:transcriptional regulatory protein RtcR